MTQDLYQNAIKFAGEKHADQKVNGMQANYLLHLSNVAMEVIFAHKANANFHLDFAVQMALLHDTLEDTNTTIEELVEKFGERIAKGVKALSKDESIDDKNEIMLDSLRRINKLEKEVGIVKLADRITNLQKPPQSWSADKITFYYQQSIMINEKLANKNAYLNQRLEQKIKKFKAYI